METEYKMIEEYFAELGYKPLWILKKNLRQYITLTKKTNKITLCLNEPKVIIKGKYNKEEAKLIIKLLNHYGIIRE